MADAEALSKLTINERNILENGIKIFENGLYRIRYDTEVAKFSNRTKAAIKFYDGAALRTEIFALEEVNKLNFLDSFSSVPGEFALNLKRNSDFVRYWNELSDVEKVAFNVNKLDGFNKWYASKVVRLAETLRAGNIWVDIRTTRKYAQHELETLVWR
ncbi:hypothetical protein [Pedobacter sp. NJ-S-72]